MRYTNKANTRGKYFIIQYTDNMILEKNTKYSCTKCNKNNTFKNSHR